MSAKLKAAVLGVTGYSGFELARILLRHPHLDTPLLLSRSGEKDSLAKNGSGNLADMFPVLSGNGGYPLHIFVGCIETARRGAAFSGHTARGFPIIGAGSNCARNPRD